jgi:RNA polymerase sigma-70 factor (ECF subfamily)
MLRFAPSRSRRLPASSAGAARPEAAEAAALVRRIALGQSQALDEVYRRESAAVYRYALGLCGNPALAADATQDAFVALATRPEGFDPQRGSLGAWLAGIARHALLAQWRQRAAECPWPGPEEEPADESADTAPWQATSPETLLVRAQSGAAVWAAVCRLPFAQREAVVLVDLQERSYDEAARIARIELNTLRTRLHRGRARLAQWLEGA